jgi:glucan 1,3-beta-glucosidase
MTINFVFTLLMSSTMCGLMQALHVDASAPDAAYQCKNPSGGKKLNDFHWRGTNLGGWLVLEPWITPSLFYQFLGLEDPERVALDSYTFCTALGKEEANRQLRHHWEAWVTEDHIKNLAAIGVDTVRIPVADWMFVPYEPFVGCWDGSVEMLDRVLEWCEQYDIDVLLDVHTMIGSQNPFDNSGRANQIVWLNSERYVHTSNSDFFGEYGPDGHNGTKLEYFCDKHVEHALEVASVIVNMYKDHPAVIAFEPVNEPWAATPLPLLKAFYWQVYSHVQEHAPHWVTVLHDSFRFNTKFWGDFLHNCPNFAIDTHIYQAWSTPQPEQTYQSAVCNNALNIRQMERAGVPVIVGEWSLATDNCAMWLNGFNDNLPGFPKANCTRFPCPRSYLEDFPFEYHYGGQSKTSRALRSNYSVEEPELLGQIPARVRSDPKYTSEPVGPFGSGGPSFIINGTCVRDGIFSINSTLENYIISQIGLAMLSAYDADSHGQFFWNFRTELEEKWSFQDAVAMHWLPQYRHHQDELWAPETGAVARACSTDGRLPLFNHTQDELVTPEEADAIADNGGSGGGDSAGVGVHVWVLVRFGVVAVLLLWYFGPSLWRQVTGAGEVEMSTRNPNFRYEPIPDRE